MTALVIGGGVAGMTAAMWLTRYAAPYRWVTADGAIGGMLETVHNPIIDYPGIPAADGREVVQQMKEWATNLPPPEDAFIERLRASEHGFEVIGAEEEEVYPYVLVATGTRRRLLNIPGEREGLGGWVRTSTARAPEDFRDKRVVVIGGGDAAVEGVLNVVDAGASHVCLAARSEIRAQRQFVQRLHGLSALVRKQDVEATAIERERDECRVRFDDGSSVTADIVVVRIGVEPVRPLFDPRPRLDAEGYIIVDGRGETDVPGLFAAGDVTSTPLRSIATSVGDGTRAARTIAELLGVWA